MRRGLGTLICALCLGAATACIPIPVRYQEQVTPAVIGVLRLDDGTPAARYVIAASAEDKDTTCERSGGRGVSDSLGRFQLPQTTEERRIFWFTLMENFGMRQYFVCARPSSSSARESKVTTAARTLVFGHFRGDTLDCLRWQWRDTARLSCNVQAYSDGFARGHDQILRGGSWTEGDTSGSYRVLVVQVGRWVSDARAVVQWISGASGGVNTVRAQRELPTRDSIVIFGASLEHVNEGWRVRVRSARRTTWGNDIWLTYELGPPGNIREIREK